MHPIYCRAQEEAMKNQTNVFRHTKVYLTTAEVARLLRERLKRDFPGIKFSVKSHCYSGGSSIDVEWKDGPAAKTVDPVAKQYEFSSFDGSIDLKVGKDRWLCPDGSLTFASTSGTARSGGSLEAVAELAPCAAAIRVGGGPDFVFTRREASEN